MNINKIFMGAICCFTFALLSVMVLAADPEFPPEAVAISTKGKVQAISVKGVKRELKAKDRVYAGEVVETGDKASCKLALADGSRMMVHPMSKVQLNDSRANPQGHSSVAIFAGRIWTAVLGKEAQTALQVETATSVVGVRGTEFGVAIAPDGSSRVGVKKGEIIVFQEKGQLSVGKGRALDIGYEGKPQTRAFRNTDRAWDGFQKQGTEKLRRSPEKVLPRMQDEMKKAQSEAQAARGSLQARHRQYRAVKKEIKDRTRILVSDEDKKKAGKQAHAVLSRARRSQVLANRMRANGELVGGAARDLKENPSAYPGVKRDAVLQAEAEVRKLDPDSFQREVMEELALISEELERDIMMFDIAPELERTPMKEKSERIERTEQEMSYGLDQPGPEPGPGFERTPEGENGFDVPPEFEPPPQPHPHPEPEPPPPDEGHHHHPHH